MITRNRKSASLSPAVLAARAHLRACGVSYRQAAARLGKSYTQIAWVLTGRRESSRLLSAIMDLPRPPIP